jgi:hypothetical protein
MTFEDTFATLLWNIILIGEDSGWDNLNSRRCDLNETVGVIRGGNKMWQGAKWVCALVAMSCNAEPDLAAIQTAYEREAAAGSALHDKGLQVLQAQCHRYEGTGNNDGGNNSAGNNNGGNNNGGNNGAGNNNGADNNADKFLCEITFISKGDPERPYFDVVDVIRASDGWELKGGLCKR